MLVQESDICVDCYGASWSVLGLVMYVDCYGPSYSV